MLTWTISYLTTLVCSSDCNAGFSKPASIHHCSLGQAESTRTSRLYRYGWKDTDVWNRVEQDGPGLLLYSWVLLSCRIAQNWHCTSFGYLELLCYNIGAGLIAFWYEPQTTFITFCRLISSRCCFLWGNVWQVQSYCWKGSTSMTIVKWSTIAASCVLMGTSRINYFSDKPVVRFLVGHILRKFQHGNIKMRQYSLFMLTKRGLSHYVSYCYTNIPIFDFI